MHADAEFRKTGLERAEKVGKDLEWFKEQGHSIPQPSNHGIDYAHYLNDFSKRSTRLLLPFLHDLLRPHCRWQDHWQKGISNSEY